MFYNNNPHNAENYSVMGIGDWNGVETVYTPSLQ